MKRIRAHLVLLLGFVVLSAGLTARAGRQPAPPRIGVTENDDYLITTIADGVYALRHRNAIRIGSLAGNTTIVIGDRDVLVVDAGSVSSVTRQDIAMIRRWTAKPVRYLVNTHWHGDHTYGNGEFLKAFPDVTIVAHAETAREMAGYLPSFLRASRTFPDMIRTALQTRVDFDHRPLTAARAAEIQDDLPNAEKRAIEFRDMNLVMPTMTIEDGLTIDLGHRVVELRYLGRGNTGGDLVVFLPKERVVATGDLVVYPFPFLLGGFPREWSRTLVRVADLGADVVVPGHGAVQTGDDARRYVTLVSDFLRVLSDLVAEETFARDSSPDNLDAVTTAVMARPELQRLRARFVAINATVGENFDGSVKHAIAAAYREVWGG